MAKKATQRAKAATKPATRAKPRPAAKPATKPAAKGKPTAGKKPTTKPTKGEGTISARVVREIGEAAREALKQGVKFGKELQKQVIEPVGGAVSGTWTAHQEAKAAERQARITQRALAIKKAHPKVPAKKAVEQAVREAEAGML